MGKQSYTLAMYDIRGKQNFIFRKGKLQEVIGASAVIRDLFKDYLYPAANSVKYDPMGISADQSFQDDAIYRYNDKEKNDVDDTDFTWGKFRRHLKEGYLGELIYDGGGNFFVLYKDEATCEAVNRRFTKRVMEDVYSLKVLCSYVEVDPEENNYKKDRARLYQKNRENEANESVTIPSTVLPFTMVDRKTSMPIMGIKTDNGQRLELSRESWIKLEKYKQEKKKPDLNNELILDNLVEEKGVSSLLAIIHIDGNNMGAMFNDAIDHVESYEDCIRELRNLSSTVQKVHIDSRKNEVDELLRKLNKEDGKKKHRRAVVSAGDDFTMICKAQDALKVTQEYLAKLWNDKQGNDGNKENDPRQWSACAGIAIFHSHAPFSDAYRIAEECCDSAKAVMKKEGLSNAEMIDFEYLQSGIDMSLDKIRKKGNERISSRPWVYCTDDEAKYKLMQSDHMYTWVRSMQDDAEYTGRYLSLRKINEICSGIGHSNIKGLAGAALDGKTSFRLELERMAAHSKSTENTGAKQLLKEYKDFCDRGHEEAFRALIYDYVIFYDIWFKQEEHLPDSKEMNRKEEQHG